VPSADAEGQCAVVAKICKELQISPRDRLKERVFEILAQGDIVTIDKSGGAPPLDLPVRAEGFVPQETRVGAISVRSSCRIRIFDEEQSKELESRRKGLSNLIQRLTYPLADGVRWIPKKAQPLLERERTRLEKDAKDLLEGLVAGGASEFAKSRREAIKHDANEMYKKAGAGAGKQLPDSTLNLILRDLQSRLAKATQGDFLPKVTYMAAQFSTRADSEHLSQWAQVRTLLLATAKYFRESVTMTGHLKGIDVPEDELLAAMDVCGDWIVGDRTDPKIESTAKSELRRLDEIQASDRDDRTKCSLILGLIEHQGNPR
jgi:hypothetical protein